MPREGIKPNPIGNLAHIAQTIGEGACEHLLHHRERLIQVVGRRDGRGNFLTVLRFLSVGGGLNNGPQQRRIGVGHAGDKFLTGRKRTTRVAVPELLGKHVDEPHAIEHGPLIYRIRGEEAVNVVGPHVGHHLRRRHRTNLYVLVRVQAGFCQVVTQQVVVH